MRLRDITKQHGGPLCGSVALFKTTLWAQFFKNLPAVITTDLQKGKFEDRCRFNIFPGVVCDVDSSSCMSSGIYQLK